MVAGPMVESAAMTSLERDLARDPSRPLAANGAHRPLRPGDRLIRAPLGLLYLGFLTVLAVPVAAAMTLLYYLARAGSAARRVSRSEAGRDPRSISG
jgi:hypothetical protein